jgi:hypothetical protein
LDNNLEIWILDFNRGLGFEWNESKTVNIYPIHMDSERQSFGMFEVMNMMECAEFAEPITFDDFKEWVENYGKSEYTGEEGERP